MHGSRTTSTSRLLAFSALLASGALIAGCGSSGSSSSTESATTASESAATSAAESAAAKTPSSGPLATEPKVSIPTGPAPSKLQIKEIIKGTGAEAKVGSTVTVNYVGVLFHGGKEFDASWRRHEPFQFTLGSHQVIPGWENGVEGMHVGGRRELIIPAEEAYGPSGRPPVIPPNSPLVFVVDLLGA